MSKIHVLPDHIINQIAAGEVVERPASVVKELVENALDAEANYIRVEVERGGKAFIRVTDNGVGMDREDAKAAFLRHATSKISDAEDLFRIYTFGFRGEALSSIASVAQVKLETKLRGAMIGTEATVNGDEKSVRDSGVPEGTRVTVRNLFYNTPVRQKFLKTDATEYGHILGYLTALAMVRYDAGFTFLNDGKVVFDLPQARDSLTRVSALLGKDMTKDMIPVFHDGEEFKIEGFIGKPAIARSSRQHQYLFVNDRVISNPSLAFAVKESYGNLLPDGKFPVFVISLKIASQLIDVNVHPRKMEVKFADPQAVFRHLKGAVSTALESHVSAPHLKMDDKTAFQEIVSRSGGYVSRENIPSYGKTYSKDDVQQAIEFTKAFSGSSEYQREHRTLQNVGGLNFIPLCQVAASYIVAQGEEGIVLIDQHAAHERVLFERLLGQIEKEENVSQPLLMPETLELSHEDKRIFEQYRELLSDFGFDVEAFGGQTFLIRAVPLCLSKEDTRSVLTGIFDDLEKSNKTSTIQGKREAILEYVACRAAIKFGQTLTHEEQVSLIQQLGKTPRKFTCPHGRPTYICLTFDELEKRFKRK